MKYAMMFLLLISGTAMGEQRGNVMTLEAPVTMHVSSAVWTHDELLRAYKANQTVTYVVEYKEKIGFDNLSKTDEWIPRDKEFETRLNAMAWIKKRKQQAINGEDYPIKDIKLFRITKEEIK